MAKVSTVGDARRVWQRFGLACPLGLPDYLFENAEALLKLEEMHTQELTTARQAGAQDAYEQAGKLIDLYAAQYPADIWPDGSTSPDAIASRTLRVMLPKIADRVRAFAAAEAEGNDK